MIPYHITFVHIVLTYYCIYCILMMIDDDGKNYIRHAYDCIIHSHVVALHVWFTSKFCFLSHRTVVVGFVVRLLFIRRQTNRQRPH